MTNIKNLSFELIKVKSHSGDAGNDLADEIAKHAITHAESCPDRIINTSALTTHRLAFRLTFRTLATFEETFSRFWVSSTMLNGL